MCQGFEWNRIYFIFVICPELILCPFYFPPWYCWSIKGVSFFLRYLNFVLWRINGLYIYSHCWSIPAAIKENKKDTFRNQNVVSLIAISMFYHTANLCSVLVWRWLSQAENCWARDVRCRKLLCLGCFFSHF